MWTGPSSPRTYEDFQASHAQAHSLWPPCQELGMLIGTNPSTKSTLNLSPSQFFHLNPHSFLASYDRQQHSYTSNSLNKIPQRCTNKLQIIFSTYHPITSYLAQNFVELLLIQPTTIMVHNTATTSILTTIALLTHKHNPTVFNPFTHSRLSKNTWQ